MTETNQEGLGERKNGMDWESPGFPQAVSPVAMPLLSNLNCPEDGHTAYRLPYKFRVVFFMPPQSSCAFNARLNNLAQAWGMAVTYETSWTGPRDRPQWTAIAYEYGRDNGGSQGFAKENAARRALIALGQPV
ncbi:hypothetical protein K438DRAFT_1758386 [Mycena galopus ATCC 62051]|nr:hypothetical protein K438DRAFT_1758386 [Mycena galopus ATCC 62051]